uniref:Phage protein n=1 Tax=Rhabditophanes sp. KR3021 TaxID=114890 RepID=A0AC35UDS6_9BILA
MMSTFDSYFSELAGDLTRDAQEGVYPIFQNSNHTDTSQMVALDAYFALPSVMATDKTAYATYKEQIKERNEMGIAQVEAVYVAKESKLTDLQKALYQALKVICRNKNLTIKELEDVLRATKGKYSKIDNYEIDRIVVGTFYPYAIEIMDRHSN